MKKILFVLVIFTLSITALFAQTVLLQEDNPDRVYNETKWGPNRSHFGYWFINYGVPIPTSTDNCVRIAASGNWNFGYAYKLKMMKMMDVGMELAYSNSFYSLDENTRNDFDTSMNWDNIRSYQNGLKANVFFRIYLNPRRGNYFGPYVDLGMFADYSLGSGWMKKLKNDDLKIERREFSSDDFQQFAYGPTFSFGRNQLAMFAQYNLNSILSDDCSLPEMPGLIFGFKINMYSAN